jgi:hypothetical protein
MVKQFNAMCQKKKRAYQSGHMYNLLNELQHEPRKFWRRMNAQSKSASIDVVNGREFFSKLFGLDANESNIQNIGCKSDASDHYLNTEISEHEVMMAISKLDNGVASGSDGLPAELLRYAQTPGNGSREQQAFMAIVKSLTQAFNCMFEHAKFPEQWGLAVLTLIHKGGSAEDWNNYRPIAVMPVLAKLYAMVLNTRLVEWSESNNVRHPAQSGFRPGYSTSFSIFVLRHLIDVSRANTSALFTCFVDFKKAYDSVSRTLLWQRLFEKGIQGRMLFAIMSMYENVRFTIRGLHEVCEPFPVTIGVRQGCPMSPVLFGIYIEKFAEQLDHVGMTHGPSIDGQPVPVLLYADDMVLLSKSHAGLQRLLHELELFCDQSKMSVNLAKTGIVVFETTAVARKSYAAKTWQGTKGGWTFQGNDVPVVPGYQYLGLSLFHDKPVEACLVGLAAKGARAASFLRSKMVELDAGWDTRMTISLCRSLIMPCLMYGCDVWGVEFMNQPNDVLSPTLAQVLKKSLGVKATTQNITVFREVGFMPLQMFAFRQSVRSWNKLHDMPVDCLARKVMIENVRLVHAFPHKYYKLWAAGFNHFLSSYGVQIVDALVPLDEVLVLQAWRRTLYSTWLHHDDPRVESENAKSATYHCWFGSALPDVSRNWTMQKYLRSSLPHEDMVSLARFRLSSHTLPVEAGRANHTDRLNRKCTFCNDAVGDELHVILQCPAVLDRPSFLSDKKNMHQVFGDDCHASELVQFIRSLNCGCK